MLLLWHTLDTLRHFKLIFTYGNIFSTGKKQIV